MAELEADRDVQETDPLGVGAGSTTASCLAVPVQASPEAAGDNTQGISPDVQLWLGKGR